MQVRHEFALRMLANNEDFTSYIFHDESSIEINSYARHFYHKSSQTQLPKPRRPKAKHGYKVHVSGGISWFGKTALVIFTGILTSEGYTTILEKTLLPHLKAHYVNRPHLFYQDNDRKHTSRHALNWFESHQVNLTQCPASSPDINTVELMWARVKRDVYTNYKPKTKSDLVAAIRSAWDSISVADCREAIQHIHKVLPCVILKDGGSSLY